MHVYYFFEKLFSTTLPLPLSLPPQKKSVKDETRNIGKER